MRAVVGQTRYLVNEIGGNAPLRRRRCKKPGRQGEAHRCALFKSVGRSPRPRQPGATGSNAYHLVQRCTTGSAPLVPSPELPLSRARAPNGARRDMYNDA